MQLRKSAFARAGRLQAGQMNKTEAAYAAHLRILKAAGEIKDFWFEPYSVKVAANRCSYTPDFLVQYPDDSLAFHEVKANPALFLDDAKVKVKVASDIQPIPLIVVFPVPKKAGGGWKYEAF